MGKKKLNKTSVIFIGFLISAKEKELSRAFTERKKNQTYVTDIVKDLSLFQLKLQTY